MRPFHGGRRWIGHLTLTRQVALLSLVPIVALGLIQPLGAKRARATSSHDPNRQTR
jgi:hypothetical protein